MGALDTPPSLPALRTLQPQPSGTQRLAAMVQSATRESERVQLVCLVTLTLIAGAAALHWLEPVMVPLVLAVLLSYCLSPVVDLAERRLGMPHGCAPESAQGTSRARAGLLRSSAPLLLLAARWPLSLCAALRERTSPAAPSPPVASPL